LHGERDEHRQGKSAHDGLEAKAVERAGQTGFLLTESGWASVLFPLKFPLVPKEAFGERTDEFWTAWGIRMLGRRLPRSDGLKPTEEGSGKEGQAAGGCEGELE
jgi:hypothetical protein